MDPIVQSFADPIARALPRLPQAIMAFVVGIIILYAGLWLIDRVLRLARTPKTLVQILNSIVQVVFWIILIAAIFQSLGLTQVALTLSSSIAILGLAVGAGANALVQDIIAGLFLARDRDFDVGFRIKAGDIEGVIRRIDIRKIRIEDDKGQIHVMPNSSLDKANWVVLSRHE